ncbi:hypothetical protein HDU76_000492 [Blyttiomyces sp. JEL0837]|nr:hypothetical protein HDU76_000492 [Blyttiomyces sp. JEL0837]
MTKIIVFIKPSTVENGLAQRPQLTGIKRTDKKVTGVPIKNGGSGRPGKDVKVDIAGNSEDADTGSELDSLGPPDFSPPASATGPTTRTAEDPDAQASSKASDLGSDKCCGLSHFHELELCKVPLIREYQDNLRKRVALTKDLTVATKAAQAAEVVFVEGNSGNGVKGRRQVAQEKVAKKTIDVLWKRVEAIELAAEARDVEERAKKEAAEVKKRAQAAKLKLEEIERRGVDSGEGCKKDIMDEGWNVVKGRPRESADSMAPAEQVNHLEDVTKFEYRYEHHFLMQQEPWNGFTWYDADALIYDGGEDEDDEGQASDGSVGIVAKVLEAVKRQSNSGLVETANKAELDGEVAGVEGRSTTLKGGSPISSTAPVEKFAADSAEVTGKFYDRDQDNSTNLKQFVEVKAAPFNKFRTNDNHGEFAKVDAAKPVCDVEDMNKKTERPKTPAKAGRQNRKPKSLATQPTCPTAQVHKSTGYSVNVSWSCALAKDRKVTVYELSGRSIGDGWRILYTGHDKAYCLPLNGETMLS